MIPIDLKQTNRAMAKFLWRTLLADFPLAILSGLAAMLWGIWLIFPWWTAFTTFPAYAHMATIAPEWVWGTVIAGSGLLLLIGVRYRWRRACQVGVFGIFVIRLFTAILFSFSTGGQSPAAGDHLIFAIMAAWSFLFISVVHIDDK